MSSQIVRRLSVVVLGIVGGYVIYRLVDRLYFSKKKDKADFRKETSSCRKVSISGVSNLVFLEDLTTCSSLSGHQVATLFTLLQSEDSGLVERTLSTIGNLAAFTTNQNAIREAGLLQAVMDILCSDTSPRIQTCSCQALANLAMNLTNQQVIQSCLPYVVNKVVQCKEKDTSTLSSLRLLTNMTVLEDYHHHVYPAVPKLLQFSTADDAAIQLQAFKVLVNLSCNRASIERLLHSAVPPSFLTVLQTMAEDVLLRAMTFVANVITLQEDEHVSSTGDCTVDSLHTVLYNNSGQELYAMVLSLARHSNEDVRKQAARVLVTKTLRYANQD